MNHVLGGAAPQSEAEVAIVKTPAGAAQSPAGAAQSPAGLASPLLLDWPNETATELFAQTLAAQPLLRNAFIELHGELGAGKTTLVRHLLRALGVQGRVKSPTFAVVEPYSVAEPLGAGGQLAIWHFDFYRFTNPREWEDAGFRDIFASPGLKLAEWPANAGPNLPQADLSLCIAVQDDAQRRVQISALTAVGVALLQAVRAKAAV